MIIVSLLRVIEKMCDQFCKNADKIPEVVLARSALTSEIGERR
jgi:hypothetical protein